MHYLRSTGERRVYGKGHRVGFDDRIGPSVLALALLAAVVVNFVLRVVEA